MASVVAESNLRIQELEEEKKTAFTKLHQDYEELTSRFERSEGLEVKVERLTDRLVLRESETFDYLATAVGVEEKLEGARAEWVPMMPRVDRRIAHFVPGLPGSQMSSTR